MHFLITQRHDEDGSLEQQLYEADTWQAALGMAQLGWALEEGCSLDKAQANLIHDGYTVLVKHVESYQDYKGVVKMKLKDVA